MKIIFLIRSSTPYGSNIALMNMIEGLRDLIEPMVVYAENGPFIDILREKEIPISKIAKYSYQIYPSSEKFKDKLLYIPRLVFLARNYFSTIQLCKIAKEFNADLIHTNVGPIHIGYKAARKLNIPHVWHIREFQGKYPLMKPFPSLKFYKKKLRNSPVIFISQSLSTIFGENMHSRIIYDGVLKSNQIQLKKEKEKYFLFVGRIEIAKGIRDLLQAFLIFSNTDKEYKLYIVGDGDDIGFVKNFIERNLLSDRILLLGFRQDRFDIMASATATIISSMSEGFGFTTVESIFNGCLVIGRNNTGTKEILEKNDFNLLFNSVEELAKLMTDIVHNGIDHYYDGIIQSQQNAIQLYSVEENCRNIYKYYKDILKLKTNTDE